jgi:hypothetical protein
MRTRRSKLIRSWPMYLTIVLITFLVAMAVSKCMAYAQTHETTCNIYREVIKFNTDAGNYKANVLLGVVVIETSKFSQERIDLIAHSESIIRENILRKPGWIVFHKCVTVKINDGSM